MTKSKIEIKRLDLGDVFAPNDSDNAPQWLVTSSIEGSTSTIVRNLIQNDKDKIQYNTFMGDFTKILKIESSEEGNKAVLFLNPKTGETFEDRRLSKRGIIIPQVVYLITE